MSQHKQRRTGWSRSPSQSKEPSILITDEFGDFESTSRHSEPTDFIEIPHSTPSPHLKSDSKREIKVTDLTDRVRSLTTDPPVVKTRVRSPTALSDVSTYSEATDGGDQINLNVGGKFFSTTRATLTRTGGRDSFFVSMFSGRFPIVRDKTDRIFIDRDGTYFKHILNYLRDGGERWDPGELDLTRNELKQLLREVHFYNIRPLHSLILQHVNHLSKKQDKKQHVVIMDGDRYYVSLAVELFISNGFTVDGYTGTASSNSKWVSVLLRGDRHRLLSNVTALAQLRELLVSRHLVTEFFAQMDEREAKRRVAGGGGGGGGGGGAQAADAQEPGSEVEIPPEDYVEDI